MFCWSRLSVECWVLTVQLDSLWPERDYSGCWELLSPAWLAWLGRTGMRGWHTSGSSSSQQSSRAASQLRSKFESMKDPLVTARWPGWGPALLTGPGWEIFSKIFSQFYIFNALAFCFCFVHWDWKILFYIFADSRISFREFVCIETHSAGWAQW